MLNRYLSSVMIVTSAFTLVIGQTPEPKPPPIPAPQTFAFSFDGNEGYLGVQTVEVTKENFSKYGLRGVRGVAVEKVMEGSPAAAAGIKDGDVILRFNGDEVTSTRKLTRLIGEVEPDHQVKLTVSRGGSEQEISATVGKRPGMKFAEGNFGFALPEQLGKIDLERFKDMPQFREFQIPQLKDLPQWKGSPDGEGFKAFQLPDGTPGAFSWSFGGGGGRTIGVGVNPLTKQLAQHFGVEAGVMIDEVRENSPASKAGLKAGDIIVEANGKAIKGDFDLIREINDKKEGDVALTIVRDGKRQTISVTPEASKDGGFFFRDDDGDGRILTPPASAPRSPNPPATRMSPPAGPAPMTLFRPKRII